MKTTAAGEGCLLRRSRGHGTPTISQTHRGHFDPLRALVVPENAQGTTRKASGLRAPAQLNMSVSAEGAQLRYVRYYRAADAVKTNSDPKPEWKRIKTDTYLYANIHKTESINQTAYQNSIQQEGAMSTRSLWGLLHNSLDNPSPRVYLHVISCCGLVLKKSSARVTHALVPEWSKLNPRWGSDGGGMEITRRNAAH